MVYRGGKYWNSLPVSIEVNDSTDAFKKAIKEYTGFG